MLSIYHTINGRADLKKKVRALRRKNKWTQEELAQQLGVALSTVQRWENAGAKPIRLAMKELNRLLQEADLDGQSSGKENT